MVYVDDMYKYAIGEFGRMKMSHMIADTKEELLFMCEAIGVQTKWIQHEGTYNEHFDIAISKRKKAVELGAIEINVRQLSEMVLRRKNTGSLHPLPAEGIN